MAIRSLLMGAMIVAAISAFPLDEREFGPHFSNHQHIDAWIPPSASNYVAASPWTSGKDEPARQWPQVSRYDAARVLAYPYPDEPSLIPGEVPPYHAIQKQMPLGQYEQILIPAGGVPQYQPYPQQNPIALVPAGHILVPSGDVPQYQPYPQQNPIALVPSGNILIPSQVPQYQPYPQQSPVAFLPYPHRRTENGRENAGALGPFPLDNEPSLIPGEVPPYHAFQQEAGPSPGFPLFLVNDMSEGAPPSLPFTFLAGFSRGQDPMEPKPDPTFPEIDDSSVEDVALGPFPLFPQNY